MDIVEYFAASTGDWPETGVAGVESEWMELGQMTIPVGRLWVGDPMLANEEDGCIVEAPPGAYNVSVKGMDIGGHRRISRLRAVLDGETAGEIGDPCGDTFTDCGLVGLCDMAACDQAVTDEYADEYTDDVWQAVDESDVNCCEFEYGGNHFQLAWVPSGLGDGEFYVFAIKSGGRTVGIEVEFLPPGFVLDEDDDLPRIGE